MPLMAFDGSAGQQLFSSSCSACHGLDGRGGEHGPDIAGNVRVQRLTDAAVADVIRNGIAKSGMPAFGTLLKPAQIEAVVGWLRSLQGGGGVQSTVSGDPAAGRTLFFGRAQCSRCHMMAGEGGFIGADLSEYGATRQPADIRDRILNPQKYARPGRGLVKVELEGGTNLTAVVRNEDNFSMQLQDLDGRFVFLKKRDIVRSTAVAEGLMPRNYGSTLTGPEIDNLVSFLIHSAVRP